MTLSSTAIRRTEELLLSCYKHVSSNAEALLRWLESSNADMAREAMKPCARRYIW